MQFALEDVALCPFYGSNVKECNLFTRLFAQWDFKTSPPFRKSAIKLCIVQCYLYLSHARSRNFAWHLLWYSFTKSKNIVKLLAKSQTRQLQLFSTDKNSNFWKIARLLGKMKNTVSLRFISFIFSSKKSSSERTCPYWQWIVCTVKKGNERYLWSRGKTSTPFSARTIIFLIRINFS